MGRTYRPRMLGEEIKRIISEMLVKGELRDPAFNSLLSVSEVQVTKDGSYATVYVSALSMPLGSNLSEEEKKNVLAAFERAKGYIRTAVSKSMRLRYTPDFLFKFDDSGEYGEKMDRLFEKLKHENE